MQDEIELELKQSDPSLELKQPDPALELKQPDPALELKQSDPLQPLDGESYKEFLKRNIKGKTFQIIGEAWTAKYGKSKYSISPEKRAERKARKLAGLGRQKGIQRVPVKLTIKKIEAVLKNNLIEESIIPKILEELKTAKKVVT